VVLMGSARVVGHGVTGSGLPSPSHVRRLDERRQFASVIAARVGSVAASTDEFQVDAADLADDLSELASVRSRWHCPFASHR
jgi:hypothetical protein